METPPGSQWSIISSKIFLRQNAYGSNSTNLQKTKRRLRYLYDRFYNTFSTGSLRQSAYGSTLRAQDLLYENRAPFSTIHSTVLRAEQQRVNNCTPAAGNQRVTAAEEVTIRKTEFPTSRHVRFFVPSSRCTGNCSPPRPLSLPLPHRPLAAWAGVICQVRYRRSGATRPRGDPSLLGSSSGPFVSTPRPYAGSSGMARSAGWGTS